MEADALQLRCGRCGHAVPVKDVAYAADGKTVLCPACQGRPRRDLLRARFDASPTTPRTRYACTACGFSFTRATIVPTRCPYCGKEDTLVLHDQVTSAGLLGELEDEGRSLRDPR